MNEPMSVSGQAKVVHLHGEHDRATAEHLHAVLSTASTGPGDLIVDMSDLSFFDASTIAALVRVHLDLEANGRHLWVRSPTPLGRKLLDVCGLTP